MWSNYTKTFVFRDCFDEINVEGNVVAINKLLETKQLNDEVGAFICTDLLSTNIATEIEAYQQEDTGEWVLEFYNAIKNSVATVVISDYKEVQLQFEIEENLTNGAIKVHYCTVKGFKEYQM